jgi:hypothetical protein
LESVSLRYDNQVIVNPDMEGRPRQPALAASAARAAAAAGVKPAALITRIGPHDRTVPKPAFELNEKKLDANSEAAKKTATPAKLKTKTVRGANSRNPTSQKKTAKAAARPKTNAGLVHTSAHNPETKKQSVPTASAHPAIPKPSPAISKQQSNTSSD